MGLWVPSLPPQRAKEILESMIQVNQYRLSTYYTPNISPSIGDPATKMEETPTLMWFKF